VVFDQGIGVSASRKTRAATTKQVAASRPTETPLESQLKQEITVGIKRRLGLDESDKVPAEVQGLVDSAAREVVENSIATGVMQELESVARRLARWDAEPAAARSFWDLELLHEAEYLAAKKKALQAAGFSSEEAMRLLVAEVTAGGIASA